MGRRRNSSPNSYFAYRSILKHTRELKRKRKLERREKKAQKKQSPFRSRVLDLLAEPDRGGKKAARQDPYTFKVPEVFSIIDNPRESLKAVLEFAWTLRGTAPSQVSFDHSKVTRIDLSSEPLLGCLVGEYAKEGRSKKKKTSFKGKFPPSGDAVRLIKSVGVIDSLNVSHEAIPLPKHEKLLIFKNACPQTEDF